jgi:hypothetical protein
MLPERREELLKRRRELHEQRERQLAEERLRSFIAPLDQAGVVYALAEDEPLIAWITDRFTVDRWSSIDWGAVAERQCISAEGRDPTVWLGSLAAEKALGDPIVAVVFADSTAPCLTMRYAEMAKNAETVIDFNFQTWVFDPSSDWIIEFHHDLRWCWGRSA